MDKKILWDSGLGEYIEKNDINNFGFCQLCGEPSKNPERVGIIFVCYICKRERLEDSLRMNKMVKQWFGIKK